jgi:hypothetical protein
MRTLFRLFAAALPVFASLLGVSISGSAYAEGLRQMYTPEQAIKLGADAVRKAGGPTADSDTGTHSITKTLASGLYMVGNFSYTSTATAVTISLDQINNDSFTYTTGTLRLELWATSVAPARGVGFTGYQLAIAPTLNPMAPRTFYSNVVRTTTYTLPPNGTYWMVLVLTEFNTACSGNYCIVDSGVFPNQHTFGSPPLSGNVTVASQQGQQCYENYALLAFNLLQQITPDLFQDYPSSVSCTSLGMPFFAGLLSTDTTVRVYTTNSTVAQLLCSVGVIASCTNPPASTQSYTDLWWDPAESGWGVTITHHPSGNAFIAWYTYDSSGNPKWYVASNCQVTNAGCTGTLYETNGPPLGSAFNPASVQVRSVGSITFAFSGPTTGLMSYNVKGITGVKLITRQQF